MGGGGGGGGGFLNLRVAHKRVADRSGSGMRSNRQREEGLARFRCMSYRVSSCTYLPCSS